MNSNRLPQASGALSRLDHQGTRWASATQQLMGVQYHTYNVSQFEAFQRSYSNLSNPPSYFPHDFGQPHGSTLPC